MNQDQIDTELMKVRELVAERQAWGWSAEKLLVNHPELTLGQIFSALAYYADHPAEIDQAIEEDLQYADRLRREAEPLPLTSGEGGRRPGI